MTIPTKMAIEEHLSYFRDRDSEYGIYNSRKFILIYKFNFLYFYLLYK